MSGSLGPPCFTYGWEVLGHRFLCGTAQAAGGWDGSLLSHSFPSAPSLSGYSVLGSREHLSDLASPLQDRAEGQLPSAPHPRGRRQVGSRTPTGAEAGPWDVVSTLDFCYLSDLGSLMTVK